MLLRFSQPGPQLLRFHLILLRVSTDFLQSAQLRGLFHLSHQLADRFALQLVLIFQLRDLGLQLFRRILVLGPMLLRFSQPGPQLLRFHLILLRVSTDFLQCTQLRGLFHLAHQLLDGIGLPLLILLQLRHPLLQLCDSSGVHRHGLGRCQFTFELVALDLERTEASGPRKRRQFFDLLRELQNGCCLGSLTLFQTRNSSLQLCHLAGFITVSSVFCRLRVSASQSSSLGNQRLVLGEELGILRLQDREISRFNLVGLSDLLGYRGQGLPDLLRPRAGHREQLVHHLP